MKQTVQKLKNKGYTKPDTMQIGSTVYYVLKNGKGRVVVIDEEIYKKELECK